MMLCFDVEQTRVEIHDEIVERDRKARLVALSSKAAACPVDMEANRNDDRVWLLRCKVLNRGTDTVAKRATHLTNTWWSKRAYDVKEGG